METNRLGVLIVLLAAAHPTETRAQQTVDLDLALSNAQTLPASGADVRLRVVNRMPGKDYEIAVVDRVMETDAFVLNAQNRAVAGSPCADLLKAAQTLQSSAPAGGPKDEADVGRRVHQIDASLAAGDCADAAVVQSIQMEVSKSRLDVPGVYRVVAGHEVVLTVTRNDAGKTLTWTLIIQGASRGKWLITYGLAFVPDKDTLYFTKAAGDKQFTITRQSDRDEVKPLPAVFFTWLPRSRQDRNFSCGPTAGFGLEGGSRPAAFLGLGVTFNWNLGLLMGGAIVPEKRLNGRYTEGQLVTENLSDDALHQTVASARWMAALTFRFGSNPFVDSTPKK